MKRVHALLSVLLVVCLPVIGRALNDDLPRNQRAWSSLPKEARSAIMSALQGEGAQLGKLTAADGMRGDGFGMSVAISGDTVVVGAGDADNEVGAAYVFVKPASGWKNMTQTAKLTPSNQVPKLYFGYSVAVDGNTIVVGQFSTVDSPHAEAAYVFVEPEGGWKDMTETAQLQDPQANNPQDTFGAWVAVSSNTVAVGAPSSGIFTVPGQVYLFMEQAGGWQTTNIANAVLTPSDSIIGDDFSVAVAMDPDTIVVGSSISLVGGIPEGAVYVFVQPVNGWVNMNQTAKLTGTDEFPDIYFGCAVALSGDTIATISVYGDNSYVYVKPAHGWVDMTQTGELIPVQASVGSLLYTFPYSVATDGELVVVGAETFNEYEGALLVYQKPAGGWKDTAPSATLIPSDGEPRDLFGNAAAMSGNVIVAGAYRSHVNNQDQSGPGAAYVFGP